MKLSFSMTNIWRKKTRNSWCMGLNFVLYFIETENYFVVNDVIFCKWRTKKKPFMDGAV